MLALTFSRTIDAYTPDLYQFGRIDTENDIINKLINIPVTLIKFALLEVVLVAMLVDCFVEAALALGGAAVVVGLSPVFLTVGLILSVIGGRSYRGERDFCLIAPLAGLGASITIPVILIPCILFAGASCGIVLPICLLGITSERSGDSRLFSLFKLNRLFFETFHIDPFCYGDYHAHDPREVLRVKRLSAETAARSIRAQNNQRIALESMQIAQLNMAKIKIEGDLAEEQARSELEQTLRLANIHDYKRRVVNIRAGIDDPNWHTTLPLYDISLATPLHEIHSGERKST